MTWRDEQMAATRQAILFAFNELSSGPDAAPATMAAVARHSGISPATVYRHFPNRDALVHAAAVTHLYAGVETPIERWGLPELRSHLTALWTAFDDRPSVIREGTVSEAGREMRRSRFTAQRGHLRVAMQRSGVDPDTGDGPAYEAVVALLSSAHAYLDLRDRQGLDVEASIDAVVWAVEQLARAIHVDVDLLFADTRNDQQLGDHS